MTPENDPPDDPLVAGWLASLERKHLADLTKSEVARALRALSSCYVERRSRLEGGDALGTRGKRAAFALFYAPLHFFVTREIVRSVPELQSAQEIVDLGCGTGAAGAAWAMAAGARSVRGFDRHRWALDEASATYRSFHLDGRTKVSDIAAPMRPPLAAGPRTGIVAAYAANELSVDGRRQLQSTLLDAAAKGARLLVVEPIARSAAPWWADWQGTFEQAGGRADEWRFQISLPETQRTLARAAGLDPRELTARSLVLPASASRGV